jgi:hypothetical protein
VLYGVIAIMSAELGVQPGTFTPLEAAIGAVLIGLAMALTRLFVEIVKQETELGSHVRVWPKGTAATSSRSWQHARLGPPASCSALAGAPSKDEQPRSLVAFCGADGKGVTGQGATVKAPARTDPKGVIHILSISAVDGSK